MEAYFEVKGYRKRVVDGVYVLREDGVPLYGRLYSGNMSVDPIMFSSFISALRVFSFTSMKKELVDIGLRGERLFFRQERGLIFLVIIKAPTDKEQFHVPKELSETINELLSRIASVYQIIEETTDGFMREKDFDFFLATFGLAVDQILDELFLGAHQIDDYLSLIEKSAFNKDFSSPKEHFHFSDLYPETG